MDGKLLTLTAEELLRKFGLGNHKPGSGSAAAYQGLLSAQLVRTVISLTNEDKPRRKNYEEWLPQLVKIDFEIETRIYPKLEALFHDDSAQFDKYINLLRQRDVETIPQKQEQLDQLALRELIQATEIPLKIARLCIELSDYAAYVFDHGFKAAKGDAAVALSGSTASAAGCLSIIDLNLSKFGCDEWTVRMRSEASRLVVENETLTTRATALMTEFRISCRAKSFKIATTDLGSGRWEGVRISEKGIEQIARQMQNVLWEYRDLIWKDEKLGSRIDVLRPDVAFEVLLGYKFGFAPLGRDYINGVDVEIAGQIDKERKTVAIANGHRPEVQNFTAAHELGHALLHEGMLLHRDRPLDGSSAYFARDFREVQANKFAAFFLMPSEQVEEVFQELFLTKKFRINDNTVFALGEGRLSSFKKKIKNQHGLARHLANTEHFQGRTFRSMSEIFNVSIGAMAIRLEELDLIDF